MSVIEFELAQLSSGKTSLQQATKTVTERVGDPIARAEAVKRIERHVAQLREAQQAWPSETRPVGIERGVFEQPMRQTTSAQGENSGSAHRIVERRMRLVPGLVVVCCVSSCLPPGSALVEVPVGSGGAQFVLHDVPSESKVALTSPSGVRMPEADLFVVPQIARALRTVTLTNPDGVVEPGEWRVEVSPAPERYHVSTRITPELAEGEFGVFDLRFILASGCIPDMTVARDAIERTVQAIGPYLFASHLEVGSVFVEERQVSVCSVPREWLGVLDEFASDRPEFVFVVTNQLESGELFGYAPIGGTVGVSASSFGVGALSVDGLLAPNVTPAAVILHELGHWAGLQHVVERDGSVDTRQDVACEPGVDADGDGLISRFECSPAGFNFMFWAPSGLAATEPQLRQLRRGLTTRVTRR